MKKFLSLLLSSLLILSNLSFTMAAEVKDNDYQNIIYEENIHLRMEENDHTLGPDEQEDALETYFLLIDNLSDDLYGGSYINDNNELVVLLLKDKEEVREVIENIEGIKSEVIVYDYANYSKAEIENTTEFLADNMIELSILAVNVDVINNKIEVRINENNNINSKSNYETKNLQVNNSIKKLYKSELKSDIDLNIIDFSTTLKVPEMIQNDAIVPERPESPISGRATITVTETGDDKTAIDNGVGYASIGYGEDSQRFVVSTGHEFSKGDVIYQGKYRIGIVAVTMYNGYADSCKITLDSGVAYQFKYGRGAEISGNNYPVGKKMYMNGVGGLRASHITNNNYNYVNYEFVKTGKAFKNLYVTDNTVSYHGDSGGSLLKENKLNGISSYTVIGITHASDKYGAYFTPYRESAY